MENVAIKHNGEEYNIDRATLEKCKVIPKPTYDRMKVLRGEWIPTERQAFYDSTLYFWNKGFWEAMSSSFTERLPVFPTRELAEEYLLIAEGKWLPKKGDIWWGVSGRPLECEVAASSDYDRPMNAAPYFPSAKQRDEYIAKNKKPERLPAGTKVRFNLENGVQYDAILQ